MSFRTRLTSFFALIVVVPMAAVGFLVFRLINDSQTAKANARVEGIAATAQSVYLNESSAASLDARMVVRAIANVPMGQLKGRVATLAREAGLARVVVTAGSGPPVSVGDPTAVAPGEAVLRASGSRPSLMGAVSELTADAYAHSLEGVGIEAVVRTASGRTLATTLPGAAHASLPAKEGSVTIDGKDYHADTRRFAGFDGRSPCRCSPTTPSPGPRWPPTVSWRRPSSSPF
jgi:hypothetical protein